MSVRSSAGRIGGRTRPWLSRSCSGSKWALRGTCVTFGALDNVSLNDQRDSHVLVLLAPVDLPPHSMIYLRVSLQELLGCLTLQKVQLHSPALLTSLSALTVVSYRHLGSLSCYSRYHTSVGRPVLGANF